MADRPKLPHEVLPDPLGLFKKSEQLRGEYEKRGPYAEINGWKKIDEAAGTSRWRKIRKEKGYKTNTLILSLAEYPDKEESYVTVRAYPLNLSGRNIVERTFSDHLKARKYAYDYMRGN